MHHDNISYPYGPIKIKNCSMVKTDDDNGREIKALSFSNYSDVYSKVCICQDEKCKTKHNVWVFKGFRTRNRVKDRKELKSYVVE